MICIIINICTPYRCVINIIQIYSPHILPRPISLKQFSWNHWSKNQRQAGPPPTRKECTSTPTIPLRFPCTAAGSSWEGIYSHSYCVPHQESSASFRQKLDDLPSPQSDRWSSAIPTHAASIRPKPHVVSTAFCIRKDPLVVDFLGLFDLGLDLL